MTPAKDRDGGCLGVIKNATVEMAGKKIKWVGTLTNVPTYQRTNVLDARGCVVIPGLIDCHTHLVHADSRADEFAMRARGATYEEIAKAGGGIMSTVSVTRAASEDELFELAKTRAMESLSHGVTTIEVKSGYGLDLETELKMLRVVKRLGKELPQDFVPTFLAHMVPSSEFMPAAPSPLPSPSRGEGEGGGGRVKYVRLITNQLLPAIAAEGLAKFCDVFVEKIAFTKNEAEEILKASAKLGLKPKLHADQLSSNGGAVLAAKLKAVSADHLEHVTKKGVAAMAKAGVTAVLIPSSTFFIGGKYAPAHQMINAGVNVAISTDYNPGTSPILNLWLAATMAVTQMKLAPEEAYKGITINAARAIGMETTHGSIAPGKVADLVILNTKNEFDPFYRFDKTFVEKVVKSGAIVNS